MTMMSRSRNGLAPLPSSLQSHVIARPGPRVMDVSTKYRASTSDAEVIPTEMSSRYLLYHLTFLHWRNTAVGPESSNIAATRLARVGEHAAPILKPFFCL